MAKLPIPGDVPLDDLVKAAVADGPVSPYVKAVVSVIVWFFVLKKLLTIAMSYIEARYGDAGDNDGDEKTEKQLPYPEDRKTK